MDDSTNTKNVFSLDDLGLLAAQGTDAASFLQGQLSNDVAKLEVGAAQLTGLHNAQGRVQAILRLLRLEERAFVAILPRELVADCVATLRKRVFRAKVTLADASDQWHLYGVLQPPTAQPHVVIDTSGRSIVLSTTHIATGPATRERWRALDIAAGLPQVYAGSQGAFVAQMLNLDLLAGVAFDKGCYIGQEIVARAHYRGQVKRRMQRFALTAADAPAPGASVELTDGVAAIVVDATRGKGWQEILAVAPIGAPGALPLPYAVQPFVN